MEQATTILMHQKDLPQHSHIVGYNAIYKTTALSWCLNILNDILVHVSDAMYVNKLFT